MSLLRKCETLRAAPCPFCHCLSLLRPSSRNESYGKVRLSALSPARGGVFFDPLTVMAPFPHALRCCRVTVAMANTARLDSATIQGTLPIERNG